MANTSSEKDIDFSDTEGISEEIAEEFGFSTEDR